MDTIENKKTCTSTVNKRDYCYDFTWKTLPTLLTPYYDKDSKKDSSASISLSKDLSKIEHIQLFEHENIKYTKRLKDSVPLLIGNGGKIKSIISYNDKMPDYLYNAIDNTTGIKVALFNEYVIFLDSYLKVALVEKNRYKKI